MLLRLPGSKRSRLDKLPPMPVKTRKVVMLLLEEKEPKKKISNSSIQLLISKLPSPPGEENRLRINLPPPKLPKKESSRN